jgi:hypothetical protein
MLVTSYPDIFPVVNEISGNFVAPMQQGSPFLKKRQRKNPQFPNSARPQFCCYPATALKKYFYSATKNIRLLSRIDSISTISIYCCREIGTL